MKNLIDTIRGFIAREPVVAAGACLAAIDAMDAGASLRTVLIAAVSFVLRASVSPANRGV